MYIIIVPLTYNDILYPYTKGNNLRHSIDVVNT